MKWPRSCSSLVVFLMLSRSLLGSEPEQHLQVRWSELKELIGGKKVALQLSDGARVEGRIRKVTAASLVFKAKKSSEPADYPKGKIEIARETVSGIEVRGLRGNRGQQVGLTIATFAGTLFASMAAVMAAGSDSGGTVGEGVVAVAIPTAAAVLVYRGLAPKGLTIIEILPDPSREGEPKTTNKDQSSTPTASGEASAASLIGESRAEQLRQRARRAVMRQDLPLELSSMPVQAHKSGID
ncbi:MAG: hypothetical protein OXG96_17715 [Acidobacteria bacterium]|nr:hypothetical protein [Acidobacteriota bacterium]